MVCLDHNRAKRTLSPTTTATNAETPINEASLDEIMDRKMAEAELSAPKLVQTREITSLAPYNATTWMKMFIVETKDMRRFANILRT